MVEFALTVTFLMLLLISIIEIMGFIYTYSVMANAAKEGVRYGLVHGINSSAANGPGTAGSSSSPPCGSGNASTTNAVTGANVDGITTQVQNFAAMSLHSTSSMNVYVCYLDGNNKIGSRIEVTVSYPFRPFFGSWGRLSSVTLYANAVGRIVF